MHSGAGRQHDLESKCQELYHWVSGEGEHPAVSRPPITQRAALDAVVLHRWERRHPTGYVLFLLTMKRSQNYEVLALRKVSVTSTKAKICRARK